MPFHGVRNEDLSLGLSKSGSKHHGQKGACEEGVEVLHDMLKLNAQAAFGGYLFIHDARVPPYRAPPTKAHSILWFYGRQVPPSFPLDHDPF